MAETDSAQSSWSSMEQYFDSALLSSDDILDSVLAANAAAGLPNYDVTPSQGKLLHLLVRLQQPKFVLEIGTLGGYSSIWLARALPAGGKLVTLELEPHHAEVARENFVRAGVEDKIDLRIGDALETLCELEAANAGPFDFVFIDADKQRNPEYFSHAITLSRSGSLIVVDNVVRGGSVLEADCDDPGAQGIRRLLEMLSNDDRVSATALQTVGGKGYDGFLFAIVN